MSQDVGEGPARRPPGAGREPEAQGSEPVWPFVKALLSALIAFGLIAVLLQRFAGVPPVYTLSLLGLLYSVQATYYKHELSANPDFRIPSCKCSGARPDDTETVLTSAESAVLGVPNSVLGIALYPSLIWLVHAGHPGPAGILALLAVLGSAYLAYVMIARIRGLCSLCVNVCAVNLSIAWALIA